jgi:hypothetical protein
MDCEVSLCVLIAKAELAIRRLRRTQNPYLIETGTLTMFASHFCTMVVLEQLRRSNEVGSLTPEAGTNAKPTFSIALHLEL